MRVVWWGDAAGWRPAAVLVLGAAGSGTAATRVAPVPRVVLGVLALVLVGLAAATCRVTVRVTEYMVHITPGVLPFGTQVPLRGIRSATVVHVRSKAWGSWGVPWVPRRGYAALLRSGPALKLTLTSNRIHLVSIDDPWGAVAAVRLARATARPASPASGDE
jgi:hypothetical protein